jgi:hypothetical protein
MRILTVHDPDPEITQLYRIPNQDDVPLDALQVEPRRVSASASGLKISKVASSFAKTFLRFFLRQ